MKYLGYCDIEIDLTESTFRNVQLIDIPVLKSVEINSNTNTNINDKKLSFSEKIELIFLNFKVARALDKKNKNSLK